MHSYAELHISLTAFISRLFLFNARAFRRLRMLYFNIVLTET